MFSHDSQSRAFQTNVRMFDEARNILSGECILKQDKKGILIAKDKYVLQEAAVTRILDIPSH